MTSLNSVHGLRIFYVFMIAILLRCLSSQTPYVNHPTANMLREKNHYFLGTSFELAEMGRDRVRDSFLRVATRIFSIRIVALNGQRERFMKI